MTQDLTTSATLKLDYNNDTLVTDLVHIKNLKQLKKKMDYRF